MAHNNVEIEIKLPLTPQEFASVKERVSQMAKFVKTNEQKDEYFTPAHRNFVEPTFPFEWLSIRQRGGKTILNYKHYYPENVESTTHCDEFETPVENVEQLRKIFTVLNLQSLVTVEKLREVYANEDFEIAFDTVKDLGHFVEIEALRDLGTVEETRNKLFAFAQQLGVPIRNYDKKGYPRLLMERNGLLQS